MARDAIGGFWKYDGTYYTIEGSGGTFGVKLNTANTVYLYGGIVGGQDLYLAANVTNPYPFILLTGGAGISQRVGGGDTFEIKETTNAIVTFNMTGSHYYTDTTTGTAWKFHSTSSTTGRVIWVEGTTVTTGKVLTLQANSTNMTTGYIVEILSGTTASDQVVLIDKNGTLTINTLTNNIGIDLSGIAATNPTIKFVTDNTDPTSGGGAATGRIAIDIGGATKYIAYY